MLSSTSSRRAGIRRVDTEQTWASAADFKFRYSPALGDAFALGTAAYVDGMLLVGADDDYDDVTDVPNRTVPRGTGIDSVSRLTVVAIDDLLSALREILAVLIQKTVA